MSVHPRRNILICSDGTANTFGQRVSNIARLIQLVQLNDPVQQLAFYDQGIGTDSRLVETVEAYKAAPGIDRKALTILPGPYGRSRLLAKAYEARRADLRLSDEGRACIGLPDPEAVVHESLTRGWCISENGPRWELDNQYPKPKRFFKCGRTGYRSPMQFARGGKIFLHASVGPGYDIETEHVFTVPSPNRPRGGKPSR